MHDVDDIPAKLPDQGEQRRQRPGPVDDLDAQR